MAAALTRTTIKRAFWSVLKTDSAGTATRAALGDGANSIVRVNALKNHRAISAPFLTIRYGPMPGQALDVRTLYPTIWLYDDPAEEWERLDTLAVLIEAAYPRDAIAYCYINYAGGVGDEVTDAALGGRPALALRYQVIARF